MKSFVCVAAFVTLALGCGSPSYAQLIVLSRQQLTEMTQAWKGERFPDGRPKVSDQLLDRLRDVDAEEAFQVLKPAGFPNQFEGGWKTINASDQRLVGRVMTAQFMPLRPDLDSLIRANGKKEKELGVGENSWVINELQPGDVLVVDLFGKIKDGTFIGDNLGTSIYTKSHNGLIVDGAVRDTTGLSKIEGLRVFCRGTHPTALKNVMLVGINIPIRIGRATVMPGDIAVSDAEGITFIPPQMVQKVADQADVYHAADAWGHLMLHEQKYKPGQIDGYWTNEMIREFNRWAPAHGYKAHLEEKKDEKENEQ
jgi:4-hydroxy-4-methyl-2-oxoglutarate aldolase